MEAVTNKYLNNAKTMLEGIKRQMNPKSLIYKIALYILLIDLAFVFLYPFLYMIITSIKSPDDLIDITVKWIPKDFYFKNFVIAFNSLKYVSGFINSVLVTGLSVGGHILGCSFVAYGFARYKFPGRDILFGIVLLTLVVPVQVLIFPLYMQYSKLGLLNTFIPIILPTFVGFGLRGGLFVFIFRQFFLGLPYELEDAAKVDGCNALRTYWFIVRPIAGSATLVASILAMVWHWNDYFEPNLYLTNPKLWLLPANLPVMFQSLSAAPTDEFMLEGDLIFNQAVIMAGTFLVILPLLITFLILQKKFMQGIERTGLVG